MTALARATAEARASSDAAPKPVRRVEFFTSLESLRGVAAMLVVLYHLPPWNPGLHGSALARNGHVSVEFFFVLSGFVLYHGYGTRLGDAAAVRRFIALRLGRIYPVHLVFTAVFALIELVKLAGSGHAGFHSLAVEPTFGRWSLAVGENLLLLQGFDANVEHVHLNFPSWSIGTEFYTYVLFAACAWLFSRKTFLVAAAVLSTACLFTLGLEFELLESSQQMLRCVAGFFLGCLTRVVYGLFGERRSRWDFAGWLLVAALALVSIRPWEPTLLSRVGLPLSAVMVLAVVLCPAGPTQRLLTSPPLRWLGEVSYSLYMCHALVIYVATHGTRALAHRFGWPAEPDPVPPPGVALAIYFTTVGAVLIGAWLTSKYVEMPSKRWSRALVERRS